MGRFVLGLALAVTACSGEQTGEVQMIPQPQELSVAPGFVQLRDGARIIVDDGAEPVAEQLAALLRPPTGFDLAIASGADAPGDLVLRLDETIAGDEAYTVDVDDRVVIRARTAAGLFYGVQTVRQLVPPEIEHRAAVDADWSIPRVHIADAPRFAWRGVMIDVARHFFTVEELERVIDLVAAYKINRLHLHLTDDQGWRIHIDAWPRLTEIGGATEVGGGPGGFYTQADYARIVDYAAARHITVVPEIDMPGHVHAALASYAELNENGVAPAPYTGTDVGFTSLWIDGPETLAFVTDVLGEVAAMTPGPYLHVGGDEAQATAPDDYRAFLREVHAIVRDAGKTLIGWEEIAAAELTAPFVAQHWLDEGKARAAAGQGAQLIASPAPHAYFDMKYDTATPVGTTWAGFLDVDKAYTWDPVFDDLSEDIYLGVEAPLWTETITTLAEIELMLFPRLPATAEVAWSPPGRDWLAFRARLAAHAARFEILGIDYYRSTAVDWP